MYRNNTILFSVMLANGFFLSFAYCRQCCYDYSIYYPHVNIPPLFPGYAL